MLRKSSHAGLLSITLVPRAWSTKVNEMTSAVLGILIILLLKSYQSNPAVYT